MWPDNVEIVDAFLVVSSQFRFASIGGGLIPQRLICIGLDYTAVRAGLELAGIAITPEQWEGVRVMEIAAREAMNGPNQ
ncbi:MAG: DUF1799 domain-containing protein [Rhizobiales bacterium]|nr:DUF1799 domain-containing protein [Hyphomicrobiales bacterium]